MVVDVLAQPAFELVVFLEQQLEGLTDDVGRVRIDELRVPVDYVSDFLLQADLKSCGLRLLSWCFQKCQVFFSFRNSRSTTSCITTRILRLLHAGKTRSRFLRDGRERPHRTLGG